MKVIFKDNFKSYLLIFMLSVIIGLSDVLFSSITVIICFILYIIFLKKQQFVEMEEWLWKK